MTIPSPEAAFEQALIDVAKATDGAGRAVILYHGNWTADSLREAAREFMRIGIEKDTMWLSGFSTENAGAVAALPLSTAAEAAYWENLALLAHATAAAIRAGR